MTNIKYFRVRDDKLFVKFRGEPEKFLTKGKVTTELLRRKRQQKLLDLTLVSDMIQ